MQMLFEWDDDKAESNLRKHEVGFDEAQTVFTDALSITIPDPAHSASEERWIIMGMSAGKRLLIVSYTERRGRIRLITARKATRTERKQYEEENLT